VLVAASEAFTAFGEGYRQAIAAVGPERKAYYRLASLPIEVSVSGRHLAEALARPLGHLESPAVERPALRVELWAEDETGVSRPRAEPVGERPADEGPGEGSRMFSSDGRFLRYEGRSSVLWLDRAAGRVVGCYESAGRLSQYERGRPLHPVFSVWLPDSRRRILHAGLVARDGRGVLLPGAAGSGKTSAALTCVLGGLDCVGEDVVIVSREKNGSLLGHSAYSSAKLDPVHLERFPQLADHAEPGDPPREPKSLVFIGEARPERLRTQAEIVALAFPRVVGGATATRLRPLPGGEALRELIAGTLATGDDRGLMGHFDLLAELASALPAHRLEMGADLDAIPPLIDRLLASPRSAKRLAFRR
jgi:hypothetical protein